MAHRAPGGRTSSPAWTHCESPIADREHEPAAHDVLRRAPQDAEPPNAAPLVPRPTEGWRVEIFLSAVSARSVLAGAKCESDPMHPDDPADPLSQFQRKTFDDAFGHRIIETHIWAVREGLRGATAYDLFDGYCQRLVVSGTPLWRAHAAMETLHPQWNGYGYTWRRDLNAIQPEQYAHARIDVSKWLSSPLYDLIRRARGGEDNPRMRRRLESGPDATRFSGARGVLRRRRDRLLRPPLRIRRGRRPLTGLGDRLLVHDGSQRRLQRRRYDAAASDAPGALARDESACRPRHRLGVAGHLSRRRRGAARPRRRGRARFGRSASRGPLVRRHPRLHSDQRLRAGFRHHRPAQRRLRDSDRRAASAWRPSA